MTPLLAVLNELPRAACGSYAVKTEQPKGTSLNTWSPRIERGKLHFLCQSMLGATTGKVPMT